MLKNCQFCSKEFEGKTSRAKYCSSNCKEKARVNRNKVQKICANCGRSFMGYAKYNHKYCSVACSLKHSKIVKKLQCIDCGAEFQFIGRTTKLRCDTCWHKNRSNSVMQSRKRKDNTVRIGVGSGHAQHPKHINNNIQNIKSDVKNYRRLVITGEDSCAICGYNKFQQALQVHHKDMNRTNNSKDNLIILCSNCHTVLHKYIIKKLKGLSNVTSTELTSYIQDLKKL